MFEKRALDVNQPPLGFPYMGQSLLHANRARRPFGDEDAVHVAVADFANAPLFRRAAEPRMKIGVAREVGRQRRRIENAIVGGRVEWHGNLI